MTGQENAPQEQPEQGRAEVEEVKEVKQEKVEGPEKYRHDMLRYKEELRAEREAREAIEAQLKAEEMKRLEKERNFEELYRKAREEADKYKKSAVEVKESYLNGLRSSAVETELSKLGIKAEYLAFAHQALDDGLVEVETTSAGNVNVLGAREFAEDFKSKYPDLFRQLGRPAVNTSNPGQSSGKAWSPAELVELQRTDPAKYKEAFQEYLKQRQRN